MRWMMVLLVLIAGCGDDRGLPACAELGCKWAASAEPDRWEPCSGEVCYCDAPEPGTACSRVPCSSGDTCPTGMHAEFAAYVRAYPIEEHVCFCER